VTPTETILRMGGGGIRKNDEWVNLTKYIVSTFINVAI
jgi:hypothetical protein